MPTKKKSFFSCLLKEAIFDDPVTTPATVHGFVNGFFPGHLRDILLWMWSSGNITSCRQVAQHGWVGGMWRENLRENRHDHIPCFAHMAHSRRFFAEALPFGLS